MLDDPDKIVPDIRLPGYRKEHAGISGCPGSGARSYPGIQERSCPQPISCLPANNPDRVITGFFEALIVGFVIGLTGALAPGPTLVVTIESSLKGGWTTGPKVTLGHIVIEAGIFLLILLGLSTRAVQYSGFVAVIGGLALIVFGILTLRESRIASLDAAGPGPAGNPYLAGIVTSVTNPYFWIWWLTIGSVLLLAALSGGVALAIVFMAGHWAADLGWYTLVSSAVHHGRTVLSPKAYRVTLALCGIFLVLFGGWFLVSAGAGTGPAGT